MNDANQIIATLHRQADDQLSRDLSDLYHSILKFAQSRGVIPHHTIKVDNEDREVWGSAHWLVFTLMKTACQDKVREKAVANFMARVATLTQELDEIRSIAEQNQSQ